MDQMDKYVAQLIHGTRNADVMLANERLIAAAPELLEAAKLLLNRVDAIDEAERENESWNYPSRLLKAAIAKAEGK